jgi:hypothetical protein
MNPCFVGPLCRFPVAHVVCNRDRNRVPARQHHFEGAPENAFASLRFPLGWPSDPFYDCAATAEALVLLSASYEEGPAPVASSWPVWHVLEGELLE